MTSFQELTNAIVLSLPISGKDQPPDLLGPILMPFTDLIIQIDQKVSFQILNLILERVVYMCSFWNSSHAIPL